MEISTGMYACSPQTQTSVDRSWHQRLSKLTKQEDRLRACVEHVSMGRRGSRTTHHPTRG